MHGRSSYLLDYRGTEYDLLQITQSAQFQPVRGTSDWCFFTSTRNTFTSKKNSIAICRSSGGSALMSKFYNLQRELK